MAVSLCLVLAASTAAHASDVPQQLQQAQRLGPEADPARRVPLPDTVPAAHDDGAVRSTYRLPFQHEADTRATAIYLPGVMAQARVLVNGTLVVDDTLAADAGRPSRLARLRLVELPPSVLRAGRNELDVVLAGSGLTVMPSVWIGPTPALRAMRDRQALWVVIGPAVVATAIGVLGVAVLLLHLRRRREPLYVYFGIGALAWALQAGWPTVPRALPSGVHALVGWTTLYTCFVAVLVIFCLHIARGRGPRRTWLAEQAMWGATLAAPIVLYAAHGAGTLAAAANAWQWLLIAAMVGALAWVARATWRRRDTAGNWLVGCALIGAALAARDAWVVQSGLEAMPLLLAPYAGLPLIALMGWLLIDRFVRATNALEQLNHELEARVARKGEELDATLAAMRQAKEAAETANRAKSRFLAAASHDLRQPVHALGLYLSALQAEGGAPAARELAARMGSSLSALDSMFTALLDISRMDAGALVPQPGALALDALLHRLAEEFAPAAADKGLRLSVWIAPQSHTRHALSDALLVERIVRNLLGNAVKYTRAGGVLLSCRLRAGHTWWVEVWDTGPGIPATDHERVFDEFYQVGNPQRDRAHGLGLGLSIVRRLATLLGHRVRLHSRPGRGSRFVLELPATAPAPAPAAAPVPDLTTMLQGLSVAVVEDDPDVREGMCQLLSRWGCAVHAGADVDEVLRDAGSPAALHVVVADYRLRQGRTGAQAVRDLSAACGQPLPALIVTGDSAPERIAELEASGLPWLPKPVAAARLRSWLNEAARRRRAALQEVSS